MREKNKYTHSKKIQREKKNCKHILGWEMMLDSRKKNYGCMSLDLLFLFLCDPSPSQPSGNPLCLGYISPSFCNNTDTAQYSSVKVLPPDIPVAALGNWSEFLLQTGMAGNPPCRQQWQDVTCHHFFFYKVLKLGSQPWNHILKLI